MTGYLENWIDAVVVRHSDIQIIKSMAEHERILVIKAMTSENHPYEIIADLYALSKLRIDIEKKKFLFVGADGNTWKARISNRFTAHAKNESGRWLE